MSELLIYFYKKITCAFITLNTVSNVKSFYLLFVVQTGIMYIFGEYKYVYSQTSGVLPRNEIINMIKSLSGCATPAKMNLSSEAGKSLYNTAFSVTRYLSRLNTYRLFFLTAKFVVCENFTGN